MPTNCQVNGEITHRACDHLRNHVQIITRAFVTWRCRGLQIEMPSTSGQGVILLKIANNICELYWLK